MIIHKLSEIHDMGGIRYVIMDGTSLSTIINFYDNSFGYDDFERIRFLMPWIVEFSFDELGNCVDIKRHSV
ncbi:hypothetical protein [Butyrivibrio sp. YAB3001]|uniref:hypothetical protein n=1 Tax=Butyrivibrio sp. YAB3001 TaxID=1520812 RepID=UPI0008F65741|nr:hypothetical protein [Butyrivibrio sp. YAB3001]SFC29549.1 hypothetical protein SAMN02910398_01934 [Butyrivibrio sp. YAB3001]